VRTLNRGEIGEIREVEEVEESGVGKRENQTKREPKRTEIRKRGNRMK